MGWTKSSPGGGAGISSVRHAKKLPTGPRRFSGVARYASHRMRSQSRQSASIILTPARSSTRSRSARNSRRLTGPKLQPINPSSSDEKPHSRLSPPRALGFISQISRTPVTSIGESIPSISVAIAAVGAGEVCRGCGSASGAGTMPLWRRRNNDRRISRRNAPLASASIVASIFAAPGERTPPSARAIAASVTSGVPRRATSMRKASSGSAAGLKPAFRRFRSSSERSLSWAIEINGLWNAMSRLAPVSGRPNFSRHDFEQAQSDAVSESPDWPVLVDYRRESPFETVATENISAPITNVAQHRDRNAENLRHLVRIGAQCERPRDQSRERRDEDAGGGRAHPGERAQHLDRIGLDADLFVCLAQRRSHRAVIFGINATARKRDLSAVAHLVGTQDVEQVQITRAFENRHQHCGQPFAVRAGRDRRIEQASAELLQAAIKTAFEVALAHVSPFRIIIQPRSTRKDNTGIAAAAKATLSACR